MTARIGPLISLTWPWLAVGLVASLLTTQMGHALATREHPERHTLELRARGTRVVRRGPFHAVVRCDVGLCEAEVSIERPDARPTRLHVGGTQGAWLAILEHGSALWAVDEASAPPYRTPRRGPFVLAVLLSCITAFVLGLRWVDAQLWSDALAAYQPAVVVDGVAELHDGTRAIPLAPTRDGRTWARVCGWTPPVSYREQPFPRCYVDPDCEASRARLDGDRSRAVAALAALAGVWATAGMAFWG
jgi:hypothetical protein